MTHNEERKKIKFTTTEFTTEVTTEQKRNSTFIIKINKIKQ